MADQEQQLTLAVQLDDQASPGLAALRKSLGDLAPAVQQSTRQAKEGVDEVSRALGNLAREYLGITRTLQEVAKISLAGATAGLAVVEMRRASDAFKEWARQGVEMGNAARQMGLSAGQFKNISEQLRVAGLNAQQATSLVQNFNKSYAELMLTASKRRDLFAMVGPQHAQAMANSIRQLGTFTNTIDRINFIRQQGENVYANEMARTHDTVLAAYKQQEYLQVFGAAQLMNVHHNLTQAEARRLGLTNEMTDKQRELLAAMEKERQTREEIKDTINDMLSGPETKMIENLTAFEEEIVKRLEKISNQPWTVTVQWALLGGPRPHWGTTGDFWKDLQTYGGSVWGGPGSQVWEDARKNKAGGGAARFYGFTDTGSDNVVDDNTDEVHRLNLNMDRLLSQLEDRGGGGGAGGLGGGAGPDGLGAGLGGFRPGRGYGRRGPGGTGYHAGEGPGGGQPIAPVPGATGMPLAGVTGGQPFGINVSPERWTQITGLSPDFMTTTRAQRALQGAISTGRVGFGGEHLGMTPAAAWPTVAAPGAGYGATGPTSAAGPSISGPTTIDALEHNAAAQAAIARFAADHPGLPNAKTQIYSLIQGESSFGRDMGGGNYRGYFQLGSNEAYGRMGLTGAQFSALPFDQQMDAYNRWVTENETQQGKKVTNLGLFNAASNLSFQNAPDDQVVYHAGTRAASSNAATWGRYSNAGGASTVGGIKAYYGRNDPNVNAEIAKAGVAPTPTGLGPKAPAGLTVTPVVGGYSGYTVGGASAAAGVTISGDVLAQAAALARTGNRGAIKQFLNAKGIPMDDRDCGEFVAAIIAHSGGTPPKGYTAGSTFAGVGTEVPGGLTSAQPGDVLGSRLGTYGGMYGQPISPGQLGGHAAMIGPSGYNPKTGQVEIIQDDPPRDIFVGPGDKDWGYWSKFYRLGRLAPTPGAAGNDPSGQPTAPGLKPWPKDAPVEDQRATIDRIASAGVSDKQDVKINIVHKDAPPDVKVTASGDAFKGGSTERTNAPPPPPKAAAAPTKFKAGELEFG